ncbi:MAG: DMT family transporter [Candidatus Eremiobacteraeota bacterium]|nr:DMT family transporter [Candidatus Eremiobacteraeota bacterium]
MLYTTDEGSPAKVGNLSSVQTRSASPGSYALLGGGQLAVGAAAIFARYALVGAEPLAVAALRLTIASAILLMIALVRRGTASTTRTTTRQRTLLAAAGFMMAIHFAGWIWSLEYTSVAISTLIVATTPLFTTLYDVLVLRRPVPWAVWLAYVLAAVGLVMVVGFNSVAPPIAGHALLGGTLALIGAIAIGAYFIIVREVRSELSTRTIISHTYVWAAIVLIAAALIARQPPPPLSATGAWLGILALAFVSQLLGHTALNASLRVFSPSAIATATLLEPVFAAILAALIFAESMSLLAVAGGVLLLAAIGIVLRFDRQPLARSIS